MWNCRGRANDSTSGNGIARDVIPYSGPGHGVLFPSMAWHRSVLPAQSQWPFEALKFSFFFAAPTERARRYLRTSRLRGAPAGSRAWTEEEEAYASGLIRHFQSGLLLNVPPGTSLRVLLADRLRCKPQRISAKYLSGLGPGKARQFLPCEPTTGTLAAMEHAATEIAKLERAFTASFEGHAAPPKLPRTDLCEGVPAP
jgi:hypothetical protein